MHLSLTYCAMNSRRIGTSPLGSAFEAEWAAVGGVCRSKILWRPLRAGSGKFNDTPTQIHSVAGLGPSGLGTAPDQVFRPASGKTKYFSWKRS